MKVALSHRLTAPERLDEVDDSRTRVIMAERKLFGGALHLDNNLCLYKINSF